MYSKHSRNNVNSKHRKIAIYHNLPSGGAYNQYKKLVTFLRKKYQIELYTESEISNTRASSNLLLYMFETLIIQRFNAVKLAKEINNNDLLIVLHSWTVKSPYILRYSQIPTIYICHEPPREFYEHSLINSYSLKEKIVNYLRLPIKWVDKNNVIMCNKLTLVSNSQYSRNRIHEVYGLPSVVVYPGIDNRIFGKNTNFSVRKRQVLSVGYISKHKNQKYLLECIKEIPKSRRPDVVLIANGYDRDYYNEIKEYSRLNGISLKIYLSISNNKVMRLYKESSIFIYSPINEPFGLVILEAMAAGLPVVASSGYGGYNEILTNNNGYVLRNNKNIWAAKIDLLLNDSKLWKKYSKYNHKYVTNFSDYKTNTLIQNIIKKTLSHLS